ncbi:MAG: substrate-binding domain-containing protein [Conexivisphaerales archaeon]
MKIVVLTILVIAVMAIAFFVSAPSKGTLIVYSADAYAVESSYLLSSYSSAHNLAYTNPKTGGSFTLARQIAQGNPDDVFISVSKSAISPSYMGDMYPGWAIAFASDQMTIAYANSSSYSSAINTLLLLYKNATISNSNLSWTNFFDYLTSGSLKLGISDPNSDPAGLRAWFMLEAAGLAYRNNASYYVDRVLHNKENITSSSAAELVAPLQSGQIQVLFIYKSAAISLGLQRMDLPGLINLGDASLSSFYSRLTWNTTSGLQKGGPILLFITVPKGSKNYNSALDFVSYVVQQNSLLAKYGVQPLSPCIVFNSTDLPSAIQSLVVSGKVILGGNLLS